jgi:hypothetical protein
MFLKRGSATVAFCLFSTAAMAEMNVSDLLRLYDAGNAGERRLIAHSVSQMEDGMSWVNSYLKSHRKDGEVYCIPEKLALTGDQVIEMLRRKVKELPGLSDIPYGGVMLTVLRETFPCPQQ